MKRTRLTWPVALALGTACCASSLQATPAGDQGNLVVVVNRQNPVSHLSKNQARLILLGLSSQWPDGVKVSLALRPPGNPDRTKALAEICGMTEDQFTRYEMQLMFTGRPAAAIREAPSAAAIRHFVQSNRGAAGLLRRSDLNDDLRPVYSLR